METPSRVNAFSKALRVIQTCETREHLKTAEKYTALFEKMFPEGRKAEQMALVLYLKIKERKRLL